MITFEINIININCLSKQNNLTKVVKSIQYEYIAKNELGEVLLKNILIQEVPDPNPDTFIAAEVLTKDVVKSWLDTELEKEVLAGPLFRTQNILNVSKREKLEAIMLKKIENKNVERPTIEAISFESLN